MDKLDQFLEKLDIQKEISLDDFPDIDLYMDQVIQIFEKKFSGTKRNEDENVLTKTMINNYAKAKLFYPIKNKKYSKEHLILLSLIYQLKGVLSINDIKYTLEGLNKKITEEHFDFYTFHEGYQNLIYKNAAGFREHIQDHVQATKEVINNIQVNQGDELERTLLIASLANLSNLYKRAAENLVDEIIDTRKNKKQK